MSEVPQPPTTFNLMPNAFRPGRNDRRLAGLKDNVQALHGQGRLRSAMDVIFQVLDRDPDHNEALSLAMIIAGASRTDVLQSSEPLTPEYYGDSRIDPIFAVCSHCKKSSWIPRNFLLQLEQPLYVKNPIGLQCYACGYVLCRKCLSSNPTSLETPNVPEACLNCGKKELRTPVYPTGRSPLQMQRHARLIDQVFVFREGPVPPTADWLSDHVRAFSPDAIEDGAAIIGLPVPRWPDDIETFALRYILYDSEQEGRDISQAGAECALARDQLGNRVYVVKLLHETVPFTDPRSP